MPHPPRAVHRIAATRVAGRSRLRTDTRSPQRGLPELVAALHVGNWGEPLGIASLYVQGTFLAVSAAALASNSAACPAPAPHAVAIPALGLEPLAPLRAGWDTAQALTDDPPLRLGEVAYRVAQILHEDGIEGVRVLFEEAIETGYIDLPIDIAAFMQEHAIRTHLDAYRVAAVGQARAGTCRGAGSLT